MTTKMEAIEFLENQIMLIWRSVISYEEQIRPDMREDDRRMMQDLIERSIADAKMYETILNLLHQSQEGVSKAKEVLTAAGYHVPALWHLRDVMDKYECDEDTAWHILHEVIDKSIWRINESIDEMAQEHELKPKQQ